MKEGYENCEYYCGGEWEETWWGDDDERVHWLEKCSNSSISGDGVCLGDQCPKAQKEATKKRFSGITVNGRPLADMLIAEEGGD